MNFNEYRQAEQLTEEQRRALEAVRKAATDPTLKPGDIVFSNGAYATVTEINRLAPGAHAASPIRNDWTAVQVVTDNGTRWTGVQPETVPQSGYTPCACRDCMDTAITSDNKPARCPLCWEAGCEPFAPDSDDYNALPGHMRECQREDAYSDDVADAGTGHGAYEYRSGA